MGGDQHLMNHNTRVKILAFENKTISLEIFAENLIWFWINKYFHLPILDFFK